MHTTEQTINEILDLAAMHFKVSREQLSADNDFFKKLGIDSLQALELLTRLENHFNVELPDYEVQGVTDFRTLAERIQARLRASPLPLAALIRRPKQPCPPTPIPKS